MSDSSSSSATSGMTIDIRPMIEDVSKIMTKHITTILSGVIGEYSIYKETHDTIMGLPCVRKLQERISELEEGRESTTTTTTTTTQTQAGGAATTSSAREQEIIELQCAIAELNRYITALESKVNVKSEELPASNVSKEEESVKLEIHEEDTISENDEDATEPCIVSSTHKNIIISTASEDAEAEEAEAEAEDAEAEDAEAEAEEAEAEAEEAEEAEAEESEEAEAEKAEDEEAEDEDAEAEAEAEEAEAEEGEDAEAEAEEGEAEAEAEDAEADTEEAEDAEAEAEDAEAEAEDADAEEAEEAEAEAEEVEAEAEEGEIEVSEVKIKGKTYFTTDAVNGIIYACVDDDVGDEVGVFKNGVAVFNKTKK